MSNLKRAFNFLKRNGFKKTIIGSMEKISNKRKKRYEFSPIGELEISLQKNSALLAPALFSILVPTYETNPLYLRAMIDSVIAQTYGNWELIIADASTSNVVKEELATYVDPRIRFFKLEGNEGISENTNRALQLANGEFTCLLDHDDLITTNALFEMEKAIKKEHALFIYSDEDKCDETGTRFFEPHFKEKFNLDLFLTNNFICHFIAVDTKILKEIGFRKEFDGAQDYDCFLRIVRSLQYSFKDKYKEKIIHIDKVLYHWRCHQASTAANPTSKIYAYEAGRLAVDAFYKEWGVVATVTHDIHVGYFSTKFYPDIFTTRKDIGAVGGFIYRRGKVFSGPMDASGNVLFLGLSKYYSGYMNGATSMRDVAVLDIRKIKVRPECVSILEELLHIFLIKDLNTLENENELAKKISIQFGERLAKKGYLLLFDPKL